jgi:4-amino-4-deoxy-L-arabinose transferase-like glycosyltransferase
VLIVLATAALHLMLALRFPLAEDETYYWEWSRRPDWGYYDQGPMIAWWIRGGCALFGDNELGIRITAIVAFLFTQVFVFLLARSVFGVRAAIVSIVALTLTPLAMAGGFLATYDPQLILFWSAALYFSHLAVEKGSRASWIAVGAAFGLGMLSKYTMVAFAPCLLAFLLSSPDRRRLLAGPYPWLALLLGLVIFLPNVVWLADNDWIAFRHVGMLGSSPSGNSPPARMGEFIVGQAGAVGPLLFVALATAMAWAWKRRSGNQGQARLFLFMFSAPILLFFLALAAKTRVYANWPSFAWIAASIAMSAWMAEGRVRQRSRLVWGGVALSAALSAILLAPEPFAALGWRLPQAWSAPINKMYGGSELGVAVRARLERMREESGQEAAFGGLRYQTSARLGYYAVRDRPAAWIHVGRRKNQYLYWNRRALPPRGGAMLIVTDREPSPGQIERLREYFVTVTVEPEPLLIYRRPLYPDPIREYWFLRCRGFAPSASALAEIQR